MGVKHFKSLTAAGKDFELLLLFSSYPTQEYTLDMNK